MLAGMKLHDWTETLFLQSCKPSLAWFELLLSIVAELATADPERPGLNLGPVLTHLESVCSARASSSLPCQGEAVTVVWPALRSSPFSPVKGSLQCSYSCVTVGKPLSWSPPPLLASSLFLQTVTALYHWPAELLSFCSWTTLFPFYFSLPNEVCWSWQKFRLAQVHVSVGCLKLSSNHVYSLSASLESWTDFFFPPPITEDHFKKLL